MSHPYTEHEDRALWDAAYAALNDLERRGDIALRTSRAYVVGHLCQRPTHPDVVVPARAPGVPVVFSADEALVLPDLLARLSDDGQLHAEHAAELRVSWDLDCRLERRLAEPFSPHYSELLAAARARIADPQE